MTNLFKNQTENRYRAGWRILLFLLVFWTFSSLIFVIKPLLGDLTKREYLSNYSLVIVAVLAISATISTWLARKYLDKKTFKSLGLDRQHAFKDLIFGFMLSGLMAGLFLGMVLFFGFAEFLGINFQLLPASSDYLEIITTTSLVSIGLIFLEHLLVGYWEELAFRGYLFQNMTEGLGLKVSIILSCLLYGLIHSTNPNATIVSSAIIVAFGFIRIYGYMTTKMLWLSMGMHIGWNFFQGPIFGFGASGHHKATLLEIQTGPDWLSGGAFGPEGSFLILPVLLLAFLAMRSWANGRLSPALLSRNRN